MVNWLYFNFESVRPLERPDAIGIAFHDEKVGSKNVFRVLFLEKVSEFLRNLLLINAFSIHNKVL